MAFLLIYPICATFGWSEPANIVFPLILAVMAAHTGSFMELRYRIRSNGLLEAAAQFGMPRSAAAGGGPCTPERLVRMCIVGRMAWHAALYAVYYLTMITVTCLLLDKGLYPSIPALPWTFVYAAALVGAVLSLREHRAYWIMFVGCVAIVILYIVLESEVVFI